MEDRPCALSGSPSPRHERAAIAARRRGAGVRLAAAIARGSLPILSRFDPELAHDVGLSGLKWLRPLGPIAVPPAGLELSCLGLIFAHPLGLAAGFDKNGDYLDALAAHGIQPHGARDRDAATAARQPQAAHVPRTGRPRLSTAWDSTTRASITWWRSSQRSRYRGICGISIGKNADTPIERAAEDYVACLRKVYPHADYVAVNVSSPNTARLRELQDKSGLERVARGAPRGDERISPGGTAGACRCW